MVNYCNGNCGTEFPQCGKAFTTTTRYLEPETTTAVAAEDGDLDALLAELEIDDDVKTEIIALIESTDFSSITVDEFITSVLSKAKVDMTALVEEEDMFMIDNESIGDNERPSSISQCLFKIPN